MVQYKEGNTLASANVSPSHREDQKHSQFPTVKEDRDGCLSAKLSNLRGHFEVRWEGLSFPSETIH